MLGGLAPLLVPLARGPLPVLVSILMLAGFLMGLGQVVYNVTQVSLRQAITPGRLLGRMNASMRFLVWGTMPIGALIGGAVGANDRDLSDNRLQHCWRFARSIVGILLAAALAQAAACAGREMRARQNRRSGCSSAHMY